MSNNTRDSSAMSDTSYDSTQPQKQQCQQRMIQGKYPIQQCMETAERVVCGKTSSYKLLDVCAENLIPKFQMDDLRFGKILGKGAFCAVTEITKINSSNKTKTSFDKVPCDILHDEHTIQNVIQDRKFMETYCLRGVQNDCRYAIKAVQSSCESNAQTYINGVVDLAVEARFLSVIRHPNIIKMRAMAETSPFSATQPFFIVLDRLYDILGRRIVKWKKEIRCSLRLFDCRYASMEQELWMERISVLLDLATALHYLHRLHIVYRDIKPDNIGFDVRGDVKIFDFGLSKELDPATKDENGFYNMTSDTGSPRYMAPEILLGQPYNELVDVYSFSILMWQVLKLQTPYEGYTMSVLKRRVIDGGGRPKCDPKWSQPLRDVMHRGWGTPKDRPTMDEVLEILRNEMNGGASVTTRGVSNDLDISRKSDTSLLGMK